MYLGYLGHKTANVPIVKGIAPPRELFAIDGTKIVGLTIGAERLAEIRKVRVRSMGGGKGGYAELVQIYEELDEAAAVHRKLGCPVIDVTDLSVEETAHRIIRSVEHRRRDTEAATRRLKEPPRVSPLRWASWFAILAAADLVFYVVLTPIWLGIRVAGWLADRRHKAQPTR